MIKYVTFSVLSNSINSRPGEKPVDYKMWINDHANKIRITIDVFSDLTKNCHLLQLTNKNSPIFVFMLIFIMGYPV